MAIVSEINKKVAELNTLFEEAALHYIKFDCRFNQDQGFLGIGMLGHLSIKAYKEFLE